VLRPQRKGPAGGWVERGAQYPTTIQNVSPTLLGRSVFEGRSAPFLRRRAEFDRRGFQGGLLPLVSLRKPKGVGQATRAVGLGAKSPIPIFLVPNSQI